MCREAPLCTSCLAKKSNTHTCVIQKCTLCFGPHNVLLCPTEGMEKVVLGNDDLPDTYSAAQVAESMLALARKGVRESGLYPVEEVMVEGDGGATLVQTPPGTGWPARPLYAGRGHGTPYEEEGQEAMYSPCEKTDDPSVAPASTPPTVGYTNPLRISTPTEEQVMENAVTASHPPGLCHPVLCSKKGMKYCLFDEVNALREIKKGLQKNQGSETECPSKKGDYTYQEEHAILKRVSVEMDRELIRKEEEKAELQRQLQEIERKKKVIEAKYETILKEHTLMQTRVKVIVDDNMSPEESKSTTTEEWNQESDEEDSEPDHLGTDPGNVEPPSSSSEDDTGRGEEKW